MREFIINHSIFLKFQFSKISFPLILLTPHNGNIKFYNFYASWLRHELYFIIRDYQSTRRPCNPRFVSLFEGPNPFLSVQTSVFDVPLIQTEPSGKKARILHVEVYCKMIQSVINRFSAPKSIKCPFMSIIPLNVPNTKL